MDNGMETIVDDSRLYFHPVTRLFLSRALATLSNSETSLLPTPRSPTSMVEPLVPPAGNLQPPPLTIGYQWTPEHQWRGGGRRDVSELLRVARALERNRRVTGWKYKRESSTSVSISLPISLYLVWHLGRCITRAP